jgi:hypothetical protein
MGMDEYSWQTRNMAEPEIWCVFDTRLVPIRDEKISLPDCSRLGSTWEIVR